MNCYCLFTLTFISFLLQRVHLYQFILVQNDDLTSSLNYFQSSINLSSVDNLIAHFSLIPTNNLSCFNI